MEGRSGVVWEEGPEGGKPHTKNQAGCRKRYPTKSLVLALRDAALSPTASAT